MDILRLEGRERSFADIFWNKYSGRQGIFLGFSLDKNTVTKILVQRKMGTNSLLLELWEGTIPAVIHLYPADVTSMEQPKPLYVMLPRVGYLGNISDEVIEHFKEFVPICRSTEVWFDVDCQPLNWW
jgi:hypothetical protein